VGEVILGIVIFNQCPAFVVTDKRDNAVHAMTYGIAAK
jgi:hypothetical protein